MKRTSIVLLAAAMLGLAAPAIAQDQRPAQTVESAVAFLNTLAKQNMVSATAIGGSQWDGLGSVNDGEYGATFSDQFVAGFELAPDNRCVALFRFASVEGKKRVRTPTSAAPYWNFLHPLSAYVLPDNRDEINLKDVWGPSTGHLDFARLSSVQQAGSDVVIPYTRYNGMVRNPALYFRVSSPDLAARVAYAMEFIRAECDPTKGSAF